MKLLLALKYKQNYNAHFLLKILLFHTFFDVTT